MAMAGGLMLAMPAHAANFADQVARQLRNQGYREVVVATTLLGRARITGTRHGGTREIILNPKTGEILRDLWVAADGSSGGISIVDDGGSGNGGDDDDGTEEDDDDGDHSGSGGGDDDDDDEDGEVDD